MRETLSNLLNACVVSFLSYYLFVAMLVVCSYLLMRDSSTETHQHSNIHANKVGSQLPSVVAHARRTLYCFIEWRSMYTHLSRSLVGLHSHENKDFDLHWFHLREYPPSSLIYLNLEVNFF